MHDPPSVVMRSLRTGRKEGQSGRLICGGVFRGARADDDLVVGLSRQAGGVGQATLALELFCLWARHDNLRSLVLASCFTRILADK